MAYTKIIKVKSNLNLCLDYTSNPMKTERRSAEDLNKLLNYTQNNDKTEHQLYVSGFNCIPQNAYEIMIETKTRWRKPVKDGNILAYHIIQSFAPGEATPDQVHQIGCEFVQRFLADRFECTVSTHLDRGHLHNHIVVNSVSYVDGRMFRSDFNTYYKGIRKTSDELCRENRLSVIETDGKGKSYDEWLSGQTGKPTIRGMVRKDVEQAIAAADSFDGFITELQNMGYTVKYGPRVEHMAVRHKDAQRNIRIDRLDPRFSETALREYYRQLHRMPTEMQQEYRQENAPAKPKWQPTELQPTVRRARYLGKLPRRYPKVSGFMACYYHYCALLRKAYHGKATKAKALLLTMIREANAGEEVRGVNERQPKSQNKTEDERWNSPWPGMLFSDYLEFWLQWKRKSWEEVTYSGYCQNVRSWIEPYFAKRKVRLNEITVLDIEMFYTHEINQRGVSGNTVLHYHANIRKALSDAAKLKLIPYNPAAEVERPKKDNFVASYYSADELMEVLPIFANTKMELPVMLAAFYGLRRSEVIGLQWSAIDFERKIVTISRTFERINVDGKMVDVSKCRTKNKASFRSLPLIPAVEQALLKAQKRQHQQMKLCGGSYCKEYKDYICVDDMGHLVTPDYVTRVFREMLLKNGFRPIRYHDLRHSCASLLIKNKVTMKEVQMWLGHSSFSTTANIYAHIDVDSKMEAANMIASKINLGELPEKKKSPKRKIA